ncbi:MAG: BLUF domain-containing protein [Pseudomonadota bacterium]
MTGTWQLLYRSVQAYEMESADLMKLLFDARAFNRENGITGLLLHHDTRFMQLLEGERHEVQALFQKIADDARHRDVVIEMEAGAIRRSFPDWQMGYAEAPEIDGQPALVGAGSERDAIGMLRRIVLTDACAQRMLQFLETPA